MPELWPFCEADWARVGEAVRSLVYALDTVLEDSHRMELFHVLAELREKYGEHPILLETEADFTIAPQRQLALYQQAATAALAAGLSTVSIRLSMASLLSEELDDRKQAREELLACEPELATQADEDERKRWDDLMGECRLESENTM